MSPEDLYTFADLPGTLSDDIRNANPWWAAKPGRVLPHMRRWAYEPTLKRFKAGLAPVVVLRGPRQVGKTTLLEQVIDTLLKEGVESSRILRVQFDDLPQLRELKDPILALSRWFEKHVLRRTMNEAAHEGKIAYVLFDEVQNLEDWAPQIKHLVDLNTVRVLVTGSSALRIELGQDSLAGRLSTIEMGPLFLREISELRNFGSLPSHLPFNGLAELKEKQFWVNLRALGEAQQPLRTKAFSAFSERGAYPIAHTHADRPWTEVADQLNEMVVKRAIIHDLRMGQKGRKRDEKLLAEVFRLACRYAGQAPAQALYLDEIRRALNANIGWSRVLTYLRFLDGTLLIRLVEPLELRLKRKRGPDKVCLSDHSLRASWLQEVIPLAPEELARHPHLSDLAGHVAESCVGYYFRSIVGLDVAHFPPRGAEPEVDFVLTVGEQRIPVEVKYRRSIQHSDTRGLRSFIEKNHYNAPFGLMITLGDEPASDDPRIVSMPLSTLMLMR